MKIIDIHTHAQGILFPEDAASVKPSRGILIRMFEWQRFRYFGPRQGKSEDKAYHRLRKRIAKETQARNAMANAGDLKLGMEMTGITHSIVLPVEPYGCTSEVISLAKGDDHLIPFASVDPRDPKMKEKLKTYVESGCRGLKLHPIIQDFHPASAECMETVEEFSQYGLPVFFHSGRTAYYVPESESEEYANPLNFVKLFSSFPKVRFVLGHMGMFESRDAIEVAQVLRNVYLDTSFQSIRMVKKAVERAGADRIVFGTDWPFGGQRFELAIVMDLTKGKPWLRERLLWKNAEELLGMEV